MRCFLSLTSLKLRLKVDSFGGVRGPLSAVGFGFTGLLVTGVGDLDIDLLDSDPDSDSVESCEACFGDLSSPPSFCFTSAVTLLLLDELECSLADEAEPDRERDLDREPDRDRDGDLEGVCDTECDREREAECDEERDSDPERERDREDRDESEEDEDDRLLELAEDTECRLGEVVLCHGSIHSSFGEEDGVRFPLRFRLSRSLTGQRQERETESSYRERYDRIKTNPRGTNSRSEK
ncbi:hypothetical protein P5673_024055 [Acropora cervicornis]|uniref:Uncharacterized protein n=1 Tax=Acropora cervicornis TaxID=6130 RepID=A0AAD9UYA7_ACRCE|nr:hypothetical protein P5673_024055 [Acropora cervicornis]